MQSCTSAQSKVAIFLFSFQNTAGFSRCSLPLTLNYLQFKLHFWANFLLLQVFFILFKSASCPNAAHFRAVLPDQEREREHRRKWTSRSILSHSNSCLFHFSTFTVRHFPTHVCFLCLPFSNSCLELTSFLPFPAHQHMVHTLSLM